MQSPTAFPATATILCAVAKVAVAHKRTLRFCHIRNCEASEYCVPTDAVLRLHRHVKERLETHLNLNLFLDFRRSSEIAPILPARAFRERVFKVFAQSTLFASYFIILVRTTLFGAAAHPSPAGGL